jgi:hypothetical protein
VRVSLTILVIRIHLPMYSLNFAPSHGSESRVAVSRWAMTCRANDGTTASSAWKGAVMDNAADADHEDAQYDANRDDWGICQYG